MTQTNKSETSVLSWMGKIGSALGIIWLVIQIVSRLIPNPEYEINAIAGHSTFMLPEELVSQFGDIDDVNSGTPYILANMTSIWWFGISNDGEKEVTDLVLETPFGGYYSASRSGEMEDEFDYFIYNIEIGSLRPSHRIDITIWSLDPMHNRRWYDDQLPQRDRVQITHPNGVGDIRYEEVVRGGLARYISSTNDRTGTGALLLIIAVNGLALWLTRLYEANVNNHSVDAK